MYTRNIELTKCNQKYLMVEISLWKRFISHRLIFLYNFFMSKTSIYIKDEVRIYVSDLTEVSQQAIESHGTTPFASLLLSSAIAAFGSLSTMKKYGKTVAAIKGDGAAKTLVVESNTKGEVRALIGNSQIATEYDKDRFNEIPLQIGVGTKGSLKIINEVDHHSFGGEVELVKGDIVTDLAWYFDQSEQIRSAVLTNVELETGSKVKRAYCAIFQLLPKASERDVLYIEDIVKNYKLKDFSTLIEWENKLNAEKLEEHKLIWKCSCSKEKMQSALDQLTPHEQEKLVEEQGKLEVICNFCNKKYNFHK